MCLHTFSVKVRIIMFNATFSYISVVSWQSVLLVEGIGENHRPPVDFIQVKVMVSNVTINLISVISWRSVLLVEETGGPGENHRSVTSHFFDSLLFND